MHIYAIENNDQVVSFEIDNARVSRRRVAAILKKIPDLQILKEQKFLGQRCEDFCEFKLGGHEFYVWEPWNDNSRYWIGPRDGLWHPEINRIIEAFKAA